MLLGAVLCLVLAGIGGAFWSWHVTNRPGAVHYRQGLDALAQQQPEQAEQEWLLGIKEDPGFAPCYAQVGDLYMQHQRFQEAARDYGVAVKLSPSDGAYFMGLARADMALGAMPSAEAAARRAAALLPDDPDAQGVYGVLESRLSHNAAALAALQQAHTLRPSDQDYLQELVRLEMIARDLPRAESDLTPYLKAHPQDGWANHLMAVLQQEKPHTPATLQTALDYELRAYAALPDDPRVATSLGELYLDSGRPADARRIYAEGLKKRRNSEVMLQGLATCAARMGDVKEAAVIAARLQTVTTRLQRMQHLKDGLALNPADVASGLELARLEEEDGDMDDAYSRYAGMLRRTPQDARVRAALAAFWQRRGQPAQAKQVLNPAFIPQP